MNKIMKWAIGAIVTVLVVFCCVWGFNAALGSESEEVVVEEVALDSISADSVCVDTTFVETMDTVQVVE